MDSSYDVKSMVAYGYTSELSQRCARATIIKQEVTPQGVTANLQCYFAGVKDNANPVP